MQAHEAAVATRKTNPQVDGTCRGYPTIDECDPLNRNGPICRKGPRFGIAGWTGVVYDPAGNPVGRVSECDCDWVDLCHAFHSAPA